MISHEKIKLTEGNYSTRQFNHKGLVVDEVIIPEGDKQNLVWAKAPFNTTVDNGIANPCFSADFANAQQGFEGEKQARDTVRAEFDAYWFTNGSPTNRTVAEYNEYVSKQGK